MKVHEWLRLRHPGKGTPCIRFDDQPPTTLDNGWWLQVGLGWLQAELPLTFVVLRLKGVESLRSLPDWRSKNGVPWHIEGMILETEVIDL